YGPPCSDSTPVKVSDPSPLDLPVARLAVTRSEERRVGNESSAPEPADIVSSPAPPSRKSLPPLPEIVSLPSSPNRNSLPGPPTIVSSPLLRQSAEPSMLAPYIASPYGPPCSDSTPVKVSDPSPVDLPVARLAVT